MDFLFFGLFLALTVVITILGFYRSNLVFMAVGGLSFLMLGILLFYPVTSQSVTAGYQALDGSFIAPQVTLVTVSPDAPIPQFFACIFLVVGLYSVLSVSQSFGTRNDDD